jgi:protein-S-isoprenylcysteine O-methyltransferase Ste14
MEGEVGRKPLIRTWREGIPEALSSKTAACIFYPSQSWAFFCVFCIYLVLIYLLIPVEEDGLRKAYGEQYVAYQQKARKLIPFVY